MRASSPMLQKITNVGKPNNPQVHVTVFRTLVLFAMRMPIALLGMMSKMEVVLGVLVKTDGEAMGPIA